MTNATNSDDVRSSRTWEETDRNVSSSGSFSDNKRLRLFGFELIKPSSNDNNGEVEKDECVNSSNTAVLIQTPWDQVKVQPGDPVRRLSAEEDKQKLKCQYCFKEFTNSQALGGHQNAHKKERLKKKRLQILARKACLRQYFHPLQNNPNFGFNFHDAPANPSLSFDPCRYDCSSDQFVLYDEPQISFIPSNRERGIAEVPYVGNIWCGSEPSNTISFHHDSIADLDRVSEERQPVEVVVKASAFQESKASIAKLETSVSCAGEKLELKFYGCNEKLPILLSKVLAIVKSFFPTDDRFKDLERTLRNANMKPLSHSSYLRLQVLCKSFYVVDEKLRCLGELCLDDLKAFISKLRSQIYIEGLCHGNMLEKEAFSLADAFRINLPVAALPIEKRHREHVVRLPSFANLMRDVRVKNQSETNSVVELYYQIEPEVGVESIKQKALIDLFDEIVEEPLFNQLRTKEQLGYVVESSPRVTYRTYGYCFCVQSSKYDPVCLLGRIDKLIEMVEEILDGLNDDTFNSYRSGLISKLLEKNPSLTYETNRFWGQIMDKRYAFNFSEKEAEALSRTQKIDIIHWYKTYLKQSSPSCRRLAVRVWGCNTDMKDAEAQLISIQVIEGLAAFKQSSDYYPSLC